MKIGMSSYSISRAINAGEFDILGAIKWVAENGGEHIELVPCGSFVIKGEDDPLIEQIKATAKECRIDLSGYTVWANFVMEDKGGPAATATERAAEIERIKGEVRVAAKLGVKFMRHDAGWRNIPNCTSKQFEEDLPYIADACRQIADYARQFGITTSVENHGYFFQGSERVHRLVDLVGRDNFRTTMDVGNFNCADEDSVCAVKNNINIASFIHFKDFYIRKNMPNAEGFFQTLHGRFLRGAITGHGDLDLAGVVKVIKEAKYDGYISIEYEGMEECKQGAKISLDCVKALFAQA